MGYYSTRTAEKVRTDKVKEFRKALRKLLKADDGTGFISQFYDENVEVTDEGYIDMDVWYRKHYDWLEWALWFKDFADEQEIIFNGEDGDQWGVYFDGKGNAFSLVFKAEIGEDLTKLPQFLLNRH